MKTAFNTEWYFIRNISDECIKWVLNFMHWSVLVQKQLNIIRYNVQPSSISYHLTANNCRFYKSKIHTFMLKGWLLCWSSCLLKFLTEFCFYWFYVTKDGYFFKTWCTASKTIAWLSHLGYFYKNVKNVIWCFSKTKFVIFIIPLTLNRFGRN